MGNIFTSLSKCCFGIKEAPILMTGLDFSGKTTILYQLKLGEIVHTIPTIGFNVEVITYAKVQFSIWDFGGGDRIRSLIKQYYPNTQGLIFVVDSTNRDRIVEAGQWLKEMLAHEKLRKIPCLIFANKQDCPNVMNTSEIQEQMGLQFITGRKWHIEPTSAISGSGLNEGLRWLARRL